MIGLEIAGLLLGLLLAVAASAFFSGAETGVYSVNPVRLRVRAEHHDAAARRLARLMERPDEMVITALLGTNVADYLASALLAALILRSSASEALTEVYATAILTPVILVYGGIIPKDLFRRENDWLMYAIATPLGWARKAAGATGLVWALRTLTQRLTAWLDPAHAAVSAEALTRVRVRRMLAEGAVRGGLSAFQRDTLERVMTLRDVRVADVMTPRERSAMVPEGISRDDLLRITRMAHFSRLPVYRDDPRRVVGIINVYDVLMDEEKRPIAEYIGPAVFVEHDSTVSAAILKLQETRQGMAIVRNAAGDGIGLFTMKDLVECIVGELQDW